MKAIRFSVLALAGALFFSLAPMAAASQVVAPPSLPTAPAGSTLLPGGQQEQSSSDSTSPGLTQACGTSNGDATFAGLPGGPKTIYFSASLGCNSTYVQSLSGVARLYYAEFLDEGAYEATGNSCGSISLCRSSGSYWDAVQTMPFMLHTLDWRYTAVLKSGYVWAADLSGHCLGGGTRTYRCTYDWTFSVPVN